MVFLLIGLSVNIIQSKKVEFSETLSELELNSSVVDSVDSVFLLCVNERPFVTKVKFDSCFVVVSDSDRVLLLIGFILRTVVTETELDFSEVDSGVFASDSVRELVVVGIVVIKP
jgi:hypothetical protein